MVSQQSAVWIIRGIGESFEWRRNACCLAGRKARTDVPSLRVATSPAPIRRGCMGSCEFYRVGGAAHLLMLLGPLSMPQIVAGPAGCVGMGLLLGLKKFCLVWPVSVSGHLDGADRRRTLES